MQGNRSQDTKPERDVRAALHALGLRFRKNTRPVSDIACRADVVFGPARVAVFIDGCFWHGCPVHGRTPKDPGGYWAAKLARNRDRDLRNTAALEAAGWEVLRYWEHESPAEVAARVADRVRARR